MKTIPLKMAAALFCAAVFTSIFAACDLAQFFESVVVKQPGSQTSPPVNNDPPAVRAIKTKFQLLAPSPASPTNPAEIYTTEPDWIDLANPVAGVLKDTYEDNGLDALNFARYLAGLDDVSLDAGLKPQAQTAAELLAIIDDTTFTHYPDKTAADAAVANTFDQVFFDLGSAGATESNLFLGTGDSWVLSESIAQYTNDTDPATIDKLERRRLLLNPELGKTAFGRAYSPLGKSFMTMHTADASNTAGTSPAYVAWPSPVHDGYFPAESFGGTQAWSVSLSAAAYDLTLPASALTVTLTNITDSGTPETFTVTDTDVNGKYFNVDTNTYGIPYVIIFRPTGSLPLVGKKYSVEIAGLLDTSGAPAPDITYEIEFFSVILP